MCWQWVGPKFHSLLSAHRLIGACFLTTDSDKCMRLLTRLYGMLSTLDNPAVVEYLQRELSEGNIAEIVDLS